MLIGVILDTHGLLRPEALEALAGVKHIIHAGDIGAVTSSRAWREYPR
jgi:predicted phosphodiesterase